MRARLVAAAFLLVPIVLLADAGGNSGSSTLNLRLEVVCLIFDGNEESMASDWTYTGTTGRALSTDICFALTIAREVHGADWVVDELLNPDKPLQMKQTTRSAGGR